jgi:hypothetical protein
MNIFGNNFQIDRSEKTIFSFSPEVEEQMINEAREFERKQIIAEHSAIESARSLILTD